MMALILVAIGLYLAAGYVVARIAVWADRRWSRNPVLPDNPDMAGFVFLFWPMFAVVLVIFPPMLWVGRHITRTAGEQ